jgi:hypothetical protein
MPLLMFLGILVLMILSFFTSLSLGDIYAQQTGTPSLPPQGIGVKITSPAIGSSVSIGGEQDSQLEVLGTSTDDSITDCQVSVIVNNIKPYQPVVANGTSGINDYSQWNF